MPLIGVGFHLLSVSLSTNFLGNSFVVQTACEDTRVLYRSPESESVPSKQAEGVKMRKIAIALVVVAALAAGATALHSQEQWKQRGAR